MKSLNIMALIVLFGLNSFAVNYRVSLSEKRLLTNLNYRVEPTLELLFAMVDNQTKTSENEITQAEGQGILRIIHRDQLSSVDVMDLKNNIAEDARYKKLSDEKKIDLDKFLTDVSYVRSRMSELETFEKLHCRFALRNNPMEEVPEDSVSKKPENFKFLTSEQISEIKSHEGQRAVVGFCWSQAERDPFNEWTQKSREYQYMTSAQMMGHKVQRQVINSTR